VIHIYLFLTTVMFFPSFLFIILFLRQKRLWDKDFKERLGLIDFKAKGFGEKRIWIHAASVGEIKIANNIISHLTEELKDWEFFVSTNTRYGKLEAKRLLKENANIFYAPLDFVAFVKNSLSRIKPDIMVFIETELWPNWIYLAKKSKAKVLLLNARISPRSFKRYSFIKLFMERVFSFFDHVSAISDIDAQRIIKLGCNKAIVSVNGNAKLDESELSYNVPDCDLLKKDLKLREGAKIIIAGSIRTDEFDAVIEAYEIVLKKDPLVDLIIAPRHIEKVNILKLKLKKKGISYRTKTCVEKIEPGKGSVLILDTIGELSKLYALGDVVFLGASLVPLGGQNPVEPALWAKPIISGPSYEDFEEIFVNLINRGGALIVKTPTELGESINKMLEDPSLAFKIGKNARQAVLSLKGASQRHALLILKAARDKAL